MHDLADDLVGIDNDLDRPVVDRTGLSGAFNVTLHWVLELPPAMAPSGTSGPTLLEALRDQLGLKLEATIGPVDLLVIDHIEEPTAN